MMDAVLARILTDSPAVEERGAVAAAVTLARTSPKWDALSAAERAVLGERLGRAIGGILIFRSREQGGYRRRPARSPSPPLWSSPSLRPPWWAAREASSSRS